MNGRKERLPRTKVDYTLLAKRKISDFLESLRGTDYTVEQMEEMMERLARMGRHVIPVCLDKLRQADEEMVNISAYALEYLGDEDVVGPLFRLMVDPHVPDINKARILGILSHYGVDVQELPLDSMFSDWERVASLAFTRMLQNVEDNDDAIPLLLDELEALPREMVAACVMDLGQSDRPGAIRLLEVLAEVEDETISGLALTMLAGISRHQAREALGRLARWAWNPECRRRARAELARLGITVRRPGRGRRGGLEGERAEQSVRTPGVRRVAGAQGPPPIGPLDRVIISSLDGRGSRAIWVVRKVPGRRGRRRVMVILLNTEAGVKSCYGMPEVTTAEFRQMLQELKETAAVWEKDYQYALALIRDGLSVSLRKGSRLPLEFLYWKQMLSDGDLRPRRYEPPLPPVPKEELLQDRDLVAATFYLHDHREFSDWFVEEPQVYDHAERVTAGGGIVYHRSRKGAGPRISRRFEGLIEHFTDELIRPQREYLRRMLSLTADFIDRTGRGGLARVVLCAHALMDTEPLHASPFVRRMVLRSLEVAVENMKEGFDMRINPEAFQE